MKHALRYRWRVQRVSVEHSGRSGRTLAARPRVQRGPRTCCTDGPRSPLCLCLWRARREAMSAAALGAAACQRESGRDVPLAGHAIRLQVSAKRPIFARVYLAIHLFLLGCKTMSELYASRRTFSVQFCRVLRLPGPEGLRQRSPYGGAL